jgi:Xaa-Pro aminopeptidase
VDWVAYVGNQVPERVEKLFDVVKGARNETVEFIRSKVEKRRLVKGFQADQRARNAIGKAGLADKFLHRTGHSLDTSLEGDGANLDDYETHDTRNLVIGSGFTVSPGVYLRRDLGICSTVDVHLSRDGLEVTTPQQEHISAILAE